MENNLKSEFVTYEIAKRLKELGFNEECLAFYAGDPNDSTYIWKLNISENCWHIRTRRRNTTAFVAPLWQQVVGWLRTEHMILIMPEPQSYNECFMILVKDTTKFVYGNSHEQAREAAILKALELLP